MTKSEKMESIMRELQPKLLGALKRMLNNEEAEEVTQETFCAYIYPQRLFLIWKFNLMPLRLLEILRSAACDMSQCAERMARNCLSTMKWISSMTR